MENKPLLHLQSIVTIYMKTTLIRSLILSALLCLSCTIAHAQHPVGYGSVRATSQVASFAFDSLDCAILKGKTASFYSPEPVSLTFEVLVTADGDVKYVRAPRIKAELAELRLACTSALYSYGFAPVDAAIGERWFKAKMVLEEN